MPHGKAHLVDGGHRHAAGYGVALADPVDDDRRSVARCGRPAFPAPPRAMSKLARCRDGGPRRKDERPSACRPQGREQCPRIGVLGIAEDLLGRAAFHNLPFPHHRHTVRDFAHHTNVMRDQQDGIPLRPRSSEGVRGSAAARCCRAPWSARPRSECAGGRRLPRRSRRVAAGRPRADRIVAAAPPFRLGQPRLPQGRDDAAVPLPPSAYAVGVQHLPDLTPHPPQRVERNKRVLQHEPELPATPRAPSPLRIAQNRMPPRSPRFPP